MALQEAVREPLEEPAFPGHVQRPREGPQPRDRGRGRGGGRALGPQVSPGSQAQKLSRSPPPGARGGFITEYN